MYSLEELKKIISDKISTLNFEKQPRGLYKPIHYTLGSGGKRIRPGLMLAACNLFSETIEEALEPALGFEIFHNFTLLHDDVMDNSDLRRNQETVHKKWNVNTAILSGDAMMIEAYKLIAKTRSQHLNAIFDLFNTTALEVCEGQQYDVDFEAEQTVVIGGYLKMIKLKTAVLIAACMKAGAIIGGAHKKDADYLYEFGINLGLAFQLQDDLLDVYAEETTFGKPIGGDIAEGKKTHLFLQAMKKLSKKDKLYLQEIFSNQTISAAVKIRKVTDLYNKADIKKLTQESIVEFHGKALKALDNVSVENSRKRILYRFSEQLMVREK